MIRLRKTGAKKRAWNFMGDGIGSSWVSDGGCRTAPPPPIPSKMIGNLTINQKTWSLYLL